MALRGMARVPAATRGAIERIAHAQGYIRDPEMSRVLSRARGPAPEAGEVIAFLAEKRMEDVSDSETPWLRNIFRFASEAAHLLGYRLQWQYLPPTADRQKMLARKLRNCGIRGLLIGPITLWEQKRLYFPWEHFAAVETGTTITSPLFHRVERDYYDDLIHLWEWLYERKVRRVGIALTPQRREIMHHMPEATLLWFQQNHPDMLMIPHFGDNDPWEPDAFIRWVKQHRPEVVTVYEPEVVEWLEHAKFHIPRDIGVVHLSSRGSSETGLVPDTERMSHEAIRHLAHLIQTGAWGLPQRRISLALRNIFNPGRTVQIASKPKKRKPVPFR